MANQRDAFAVAGPVSRQLYKRLLVCCPVNTFA
jgi:hypothetical protein